jgi:hypothetical protein
LYYFIFIWILLWEFRPGLFQNPVNFETGRGVIGEKARPYLAWVRRLCPGIYVGPSHWVLKKASRPVR